MSAPAPVVTIDARMATDGGIGTYLQGLVPRIAALRPAWRFVALGDPAELRGLSWDAIPNLEIRAAGARIFTVREQLELPARTMRGTSVFWAPNYNIPLLDGAPLVVTIHDVNHVALPELMGGALRRSYARWMLSLAMRRARHVLFDTAFTRDEAERLLGPPRGPSTVVHLGVGDEWTQARRRHPERPIQRPYFLYVGNLKRHKNVPLLLRAFGRIASRVPHQLVLIGRREGLRADPAVDRELHGLADRVTALGEVSTERVRHHVAHASALVTASRYEGFGLPPLEAMAAGCPVVVSRAGSLPEVCGDAALYCDPSSEESVADALLRVATDERLRGELVARGAVRASGFTWERAAARTAQALESAL